MSQTFISKSLLIPWLRPANLWVLCSGLIGALLLTSCRVEEPVSRRDAIRHYLDHRDYEQAILLLREEVAEFPADDSAKVSLASAYSGSVGINTIDCFEVIRPKLFNRPLERQGKALATASSFLASEPAAPAVAGQDSASDKHLRALRAIESELLKFSSEAEDAMDLAFRLPQVPVVDRGRLVLSLSLLGDIPPDSEQYLTAQLYRGVLSMVQFMNYFRDAIPAKVKDLPGSPSWYLKVYCQIDLGILLPNLSESVNYLNAAFGSLELANRRSDKPIFANLLIAKSKLTNINNIYLQDQDLFEFADFAQRTSKAAICD